MPKLLAILLKPQRPTVATGPGVEVDEEQRYGKIDLKLVRRLGRQLLPFRKLYITGLSVGLLSTLLDMSGPKFMQRIADYSLYEGRPLVASNAPDAMWIAGRHVTALVGLWVVFLAGAIVLQRLTILLMTSAGERVQFSIRRQLFAHLQKLSMSYFDKTKLGRIISRNTSDVDAMREVNVWGLAKLFNNSMQIVVAAVMIAVIDWRLFLAIAWLGPVLYFINRFYLTRSAAMWQFVREGWTRVSTNLAENITGTRVVTAFDRQVPNLGVFNRLQVENTANNVDAARINGVYMPTLDVIKFIGRIIIYTYGAYLIVTGKIISQPVNGRAIGAVGAILAVSGYWEWFMNPIIDMGNFYNQLLQAMAGAERVFNLLDTQPDVTDLVDAKPLPRITGRVEFQDVVFGYNADRPVLHGISFTAEPGQMVALVGATGSGKSSIVSLIGRFYQPQQGRVLVDGHDIRHVTGDSLHHQMGLVLQINYLFTGTVMENIRYARPGATEEQVIESARQIGSYESILSLQSGFQTEVGERGANMSLGQRQLICFTRAFLADPRIFMLDEATSAVDTATELLVQRSLEKLLAGRTTFVVAHRLSTIMAADVILVIDAGQIIERGTHRQLLAANGKYAHLYRQFVQQAE